MTTESERLIEERAPRPGLAIAALFAVLGALGSTAWGYIEYAGRARAPELALALAGTFLSVGATLLLAFRAAYTFSTVAAPRPTPRVSDEPVDMGLGPRRGFLALIGGAVTAVLGALVLPLRSLGGWPRKTLQANAWVRGVRLLTLNGVPLRPDDVPPGSATPVVPSASPEDTNSVAVLVRLRGRPAGQDLRAFSRICTHAGCAVCMFKSKEGELVCPCHWSVFDVAGGGRVVSGPASRALPELPLGVDDDGFLVAEGGYNRPIGPRTGLA